MTDMFNKSGKLKKKGMVNQAVIWMAIIFGLIVSVAAIKSYADNGNGIYNWFYDDVTSGTPVTPTCTPKQYLVEMHGTLDVINQKQGTWTLDYDVDYLDAHINDIFISVSKLSLFSNDFTGRVCLFDVLDRNKKIGECVEFDKSVSKVQRYPFTFTYNLPDNNCDGVVDDHTFNLVAEVQTDQDFEKHEKTVAIVGGQPVYQNAIKNGESYPTFWG